MSAPSTGGAAGDTLVYALGRGLYVNPTSRCTLLCTFCPKWKGEWTVGGHDLRLRRPPEVEELWARVQAAGPERYDEVVFCGLGEPTLRLDAVVAIGARLVRAGRRVRLNTDGLASLREGRDVTAELVGAVHEVSVSLNAADPATYARLCPSRFGAAAHGAACAFVAAARSRGLAVRVSFVALPELDHGACERLAAELGVPSLSRPLDRLGRTPPAAPAEERACRS